MRKHQLRLMRMLSQRGHLHLLKGLSESLLMLGLKLGKDRLVHLLETKKKRHLEDLKLL